MTRNTLSALILFLLCAVPSLSAAQPLQTNPHNGRYCLLCHMQEPRLGVDTRDTVQFKGKGWDDPELCMFCHEPQENLHPILVKTGPDAMGTRSPEHLPLGSSPGLEGQVVCTTCHFLHASDNRYALMRGFPGTQQPDLFDEWQDFCRECHADNLEKRSPHDGDDQACVFCHGEKPDRDKGVSLSYNAQPLCNFCHGSIQEGHAVGMADIDTPSLCALCHDPHAAAGDAARQKPSFIEMAKNRVTLDPHYKKSLCYTCHLERDGEKYPLRLVDTTSLCNRCHDSGKIVGDIHPIEEIPADMNIPADWPRDGDSMNCLTCHLVGHMEDDFELMLLRGGPYDDRKDFCYNCHPKERYANLNPHEQINRGEGCDLCHSLRPDPEIDTSASVKLVADVNLLCLRCHDVPSHPASYRHTRFIPEEMIGSISKKLPVFGGRIVCATCHNPHITGDEGLKLRIPFKGLQICTACHSTF